MNSFKLFIASTGKDVGKTTLSMGLIDYLNSHHGPCGFMKPVGQEQLSYQGVSLDKDAVLIKELFGLEETQELSPVAIPNGFTKDYLDGKISLQDLKNHILEAQKTLSHYKSIVYEGTGHMGVGSIIDLNNAQVACLLNTPIIIVTKGGLGSSFDELMLNLAICQKHKLRIKGVVLNKVIPEKMDMISTYFKKALDKISVPFLGALPFDMLLAKPTFNDVQNVLEATFIQGEELGSKHIQTMSIVASNHQIPELKAYDLVIVSSTREGLIHGLLDHAKSEKIPLGFILTGDIPPSSWLKEEMQKSSHIVLQTAKSSTDVLLELSQFHAKIQLQDHEKIREAIKLVRKHLDFEKILSS
jgi:phosphate acetyltransferase